MNMITQFATKMDGMVLDTMARRTAARANFLATSINTDASFEELGGGLIDSILGVIQWAGAITIIVSAVAVIAYHQNGDASSQQKATYALLGGIAAITLRSILQSIGILN